MEIQLRCDPPDYYKKSLLSVGENVERKGIFEYF